MGIISAVPGMTGLHVVAGFSGHGFMHGPIAGQLMAELIADGRLRRWTSPRSISGVSSVGRSRSR
jgi:glycine/D-amino acid oxidase-like deaminating enzyme